MAQEKRERLAGYVDGFSVYYGLRSKGWRRFLWLDYWALLERFARESQELVAVKYFTARVRKPEDSVQRQSLYLDALAAQGKIDIVEGKYEHRPYRCPSPECDHRWDRPKEKMTDVNIALNLVLDAADDLYDTALLLAADADLVPAVATVRNRFGKNVIAISPRGRSSDELNGAADAALHFPSSALNQSQLPDALVHDGIELRRPAKWT